MFTDQIRQEAPLDAGGVDVRYVHIKLQHHKILFNGLGVGFTMRFKG